MYIDTARALEGAFDVLTDTLLPHLLKLSGSTKKIVAEASQQVTTALISHTACTPRTFMPFLEAGLAERTVQSRGYFMAHLAHYVRTHCSRPQGKHAIEGTQILTSNHGTALALLTELIRRGLTDANAAVKESARTAFVVFYREWPKQGSTLLGGLEDGVRRQVEKALASTTPIEAVKEVESGGVSAVVVPPVARRAPTGRKPSSAIAAAIKKAKEEARAARMAEAAREEREATAGAVQIDEPPRKIKGPPNSPSPPKSPTAQPTLPATPPRQFSLLDMQTPEAQGAAFKVMTPAPFSNGGPDLLKSTGINLVEPIVAENAAAPAGAQAETGSINYIEPIPDLGAGVHVGPEAETRHSRHVVQDEPASSRSAADPLRPKPGPSIEQDPSSPTNLVERSTEHTSSETISEPQRPPSPSNGIPRRPRVSVNPAPRLIKPQPLYHRLRTLIDCSFWLDRRHGESPSEFRERQRLSVVSIDFPSDCEETLTSLLKRRSSPVTASDIAGLIGWSNSCSAERKLDGLDGDEAIREYVSDALQHDATEEIEEKQTAVLIDLVEETLVSHEVSSFM